MKKGKKINLNVDKNYKIYYGTVDNNNLKSVYITINSWAEPKQYITNPRHTINTLTRSVKHQVLNTLNQKIFNSNFIVDLDLKSSGIELGKKSFMSLNIYLYNKPNIDDFKSPVVLNDIKKILFNLIDNTLENNKYFMFQPKKTMKKTI